MGGVSASVAKAQAARWSWCAAKIYVYDEHGRRYIDAIASLEASAIGHGRPEIAAAVARQYEQ